MGEKLIERECSRSTQKASLWLGNIMDALSLALTCLALASKLLLNGKFISHVFGNSKSYRHIKITGTMINQLKTFVKAFRTHDIKVSCVQRKALLGTFGNFLELFRSLNFIKY